MRGRSPFFSTFPTFVLALAACAAPRAPAPPAPVNSVAPAAAPVDIAVTVDDLPVHGPGFTTIDRVAIADRLLAAFAAHRLPAVHGFVNGKTVDDDPATEIILRRWLGAGHALGNHTRSHPSLNRTGLEDYLADVRAGEGIITKLAPNRWKVFRHPFLHEGDTREKRDGVRAFLTAEGYAIAHVTIDADDWAYNPPFARCSDRGDRTALAELRRSFVAGHVEELRRVRDLTRTLAGRDVPQILLLHIGAADADAIDALLTAYEAEGARWIGLRAALTHPFYATETRDLARYGAALPYRIARERGLALTPATWVNGLEERLAQICR